MNGRWIRAALVSLVLCGGCAASWRETGMRPEHLIETEHPDKIGVTLEDGSRLVVHHPEARADSLFGLWQSPDDTWDRWSEPRKVVGIALSEITGTWLKDGSGGGTATLIVTGAIAGGIGLLAIAFALSGGPGF